MFASRRSPAPVDLSMASRPVAAALVALWALQGTAGRAGTITGTLKVLGASEANHTVVYVEFVPEGTFSPATATVRLSQRGAKFTPQVLPILRGSTVDMTNDDWVAHNVFSKSEAKPFDLGIYRQDARKEVTFEKTGVVQVFCSIHPRMNAAILVLQNPFFTKPGRDGRFSLAGVPAGTYQLKTFRPGGEPSSATVTVPATGDVEVRF